MSSLSSLTSTSPGTASQPPISFNGLISGLDTSSIITGLLANEQSQINATASKETTVKSDQAIYKQIEANILTLQGDVTKLNAPTNSVFDARTATSSNTSVLTAAASSNAAPGVYNLQVNSLAQAQEIASQGFASPTGAITQGTLQLQIGNGATTTITIDSTNNSLQGLANAINGANIGVSAAVVNDGTGVQSYRLLLTAKNTGTANAVSITNNLAVDAGGATQPVFGSTYIGAATTGANYTGTSTPTANTGAGTYTGTSNNTYTFTVVNGGTVGTDNNIQLSYTDLTGKKTGTLTLSASDVNTLKAVDQGLQVQFSAGTLVQGQSFSVKAYVPTVQAAQDASVTLGSGAGALTLTNSNNNFNNLIPGVTVQLLSTSPGQQVSVTVASDTSSIQKAVDGFVADYNTLMSFIDQQTSFDSSTNTAGPLLGDAKITDIQNQVQHMVQNIVPGAKAGMNYLGALGITLDGTGQLQVDDTKLANILNGSIAGVSLTDVRNLFSMSGSSLNPGVQFIAGTDQTKASATPYSVKITQAAMQASVAATNPLASSIVIDNTNNTFTLNLDGASTTLTLANGTYTQTALAQMLQSAINSDTDLAGRQISVAVQAGQLAFTSASFGSASRLSFGNGNANTTLGLIGTENGVGTDVVGSFVVNGVTEQATGIGQFLTGNQSNANTAGLEVRVTLTPAQVGSGTQADLSITRGIASQLDGLLNSLTDPVTGRFKTIDDSFNQQVTDLESQKTQQTNAMNAKQQQLQTEFANMETTLAQLQAASNAVNGLYTNLASNSSSNSSSAPKSSSNSSNSSSTGS
jgi:flagellar hook-associated protein 2